MTKTDDDPTGPTSIFSIVVVVLLVVSFVVVALADSFFSWHLMPGIIQEMAHEVFMRIIPMK
jgi:hypothetical protein